MRRYLEDSMSLEPPREWKGGSFVTFTAPSDRSGLTPNLVITREPLDDQETLHTHAERTILEPAGRCPDLHLVDSREVWIDLRPALYVHLAWEDGPGSFEQILVLVDPHDDAERCIATFALTATSAEMPRVVGAFETFLSTVRFARRAPLTSTLLRAESRWS